jgi:L,D-peptidoglycan transpeptidase YkuD (ErfK/YbiS/YcfS/YnhG family)
MNVYFTVSLMILAFLFPYPAGAGSFDVPGQSFPGKEQSRQGSGLPDFSEKLFGASSQALLVRDRNPDSPGSFAVQVIARKKRAGRWENAFAPMDGVIGKNGFAPPGEKREGDGRTPSGIFPLGTVFGYASSFPTKMPYRQATADDLWVDDVRADDYNRWVTRIATRAASFEKMRRDDDLYKLGIVVEYNTHPVIKGRGSAIFFHLWRGKGRATLGCIALPEEDLIKIVRWLDPAAAPVAMMGTNITVEDSKQ